MAKKTASFASEGTRTAWPAGSYVLLADRYRHVDSGVEHTRGEPVELGAEDALRLGEAGAVAPPDSHAAEAARKIAAGELPRSAAVSADMKPEDVDKEIARLEKEEKEREVRLKQPRAMRGDGS